MRIMVFDVPAENGGALSVLHEFYNEFKLDQENEYFFVLSMPELKEASNIKILRFPWIKKSWFHRLYFDYFIAPKLIIEYGIEKVLSLQNVLIPRTKVYQSVFIHNSLPFSDYRFRLNEDKLLWVYQNIIGKKIIKSIKKAKHIIVQTNWIKKKIVDKFNIYDKKVEVRQAKIEIDIKFQYQETSNSLSTFFYPASGMIFKNHKVIVDACLKLKQEGVDNYRVIFTLTGDENRVIKDLYNLVKNKQLPIEFIGSIKRDEVFKLYTRSILIFPSFIETVGLPLIEAQMHNTPIIAANSDYSIEILNDYKRVQYFNYLDYTELSSIMAHFIGRSEHVLEKV